MPSPRQRPADVRHPRDQPAHLGVDPGAEVAAGPRLIAPPEPGPRPLGGNSVPRRDRTTERPPAGDQVIHPGGNRFQPGDRRRRVVPSLERGGQAIHLVGQFAVELGVSRGDTRGDGGLVATGRLLHPDRQQRRAVGQRPAHLPLGPEFRPERRRPPGHHRRIFPRGQQVTGPCLPVAKRVEPRHRLPLGRPGARRTLSILPIRRQPGR